jgi:4-amino-4-deoxy-L-arabinose transferase-like glycosyltransferase
MAREMQTGGGRSRLPLYIALFAIWIMPGLVGHDPWKPDEAENMGIVYAMMQSGEWLVPTLAGEPFLTNPPLVHWIAAALATLFSPPLELHDAARLAAGVLLSLSLLFVAAAAREFFGRGHGWVAAMALVGCLGLLVRGHLLIAELGALTGFSLALYGFALAVKSGVKGGIAIGSGIGMAFLSSGILVPLALTAVMLAAPLFLRELRNDRFGATLFIGWLVAAPWLILWPYLLNEHDPELFRAWLWQIEIGQFVPRTGVSIATSHFATMLAWFAWPVWPIALWTLIKGRPVAWQRPGVVLPFLAFLALLLLISLSHDAAGDADALPLLVSLSLVATASVDTLRRGAASALDWFGIMTFGLIAGLLWLGWVALVTGEPALVNDRLREIRPGIEIDIDAPALVSSVAITLLWVGLVWRIGRGNRRALLNWAAGITLVWLLAMSLWLPVVDRVKSYRAMVSSLKGSLPDGCIASTGLSASHRAVLHYFGNIVTERLESHGTSDCELLLVQTRDDRSEERSDWIKLWEGSRPGDEDERFTLYRRIQD